MSNNAGRPTDLNEELFRKIKQSILDGNDLRTTARVCEIVESTLYTWHSDNYLNISDKIDGWKRDRKLNLAEKKLQEILEMDVSDKDTLKVQADIAKFTAETLGKDNYSKRSEMTGKGGKDFNPVLVKFINEAENANDTNTNGIQEDI